MHTHAVDDHHLKHPIGEITFWTWAAAIALFVLVVTAVFTVTKEPRVAENVAPTLEQVPVPVPPIKYPEPANL